MDNAASIRAWSQISREAIEAFGEEGDFARQHLLTPHLLRLLGQLPGQRILDAGCGQGYLARLLARAGAHVTGVEPAPPLYDYCLEREHVEPLGITYIQADLARLDHAPDTFDSVVASMVLMDIPDDAAALTACFQHTRAGGQVIIAISHPCFEDSDRAYREQGAVIVREYFAHYPIAQRWGGRIHRPFSHYLNQIIRCGGDIRAVVEPQLDPGLAAEVPEAERHVHVPGFVIIQARKGGSPGRPEDSSCAADHAGLHRSAAPAAGPTARQSGSL